MADDSEPSDETDQCIALTRSGERCSRTAEDGNFCYQHDESDETTADAVAVDGGTEAESGSQSQSQSESDDEADGESEAEEEAESESDEQSEVDTVNELEEAAGEIESETDSEESREDGVDILEVRQLVETTASDLIGRELDGISEIRAEEDGWLVVVDLIERPAVPDSQDILGSYEIELGRGGSIQGYRRINRYRRSDTADVE